MKKEIQEKADKFLKGAEILRQIEEAEQIKERLIKMAFRDLYLLFEDKAQFSGAVLFPSRDSDFKKTPLETYIWEGIESKIHNLLTYRIDEVIKTLTEEFKAL